MSRAESVNTRWKHRKKHFYLYILNIGFFFFFFPLFFWKMDMCSLSLEVNMQTQTIQYASAKSNFPFSGLFACLDFYSLWPFFAPCALQLHFSLYLDNTLCRFMKSYQSTLFCSFQSVRLAICLPHWEWIHMSSCLLTLFLLFFFPQQLKKVKSKTKQINVYGFVISFFLFIYLFISSSVTKEAEQLARSSCCQRVNHSYIDLIM